MTKVRVIAGVSLVVLALAAALCAVRISEVNAAYPEHKTISYAMGEAVPAPSGAGGAEEGGVCMEILDFTVVDADEFSSRYPGYTRGSEGSEDRAVVLVAWIELRATGREASRASLSSVHLQSGAWANGMDAIAYQVMNDNLGANLKIEPGETAFVAVPFSVSSSYIGRNDLQSFVSDGDFSLVVSVYPDKVSVDLGIPRETGADIDTDAVAEAPGEEGGEAS